MVSTWSTNDFIDRVAYMNLPKADEVTQLLEHDGIDFANTRVILLAESFDPEVILSANWLAQYNVPILAFSITPLEPEEEIIFSIVQRFPLPELEDVYKARTTRRASTCSVWADVLTRLTLPFAEHVIEVLTAYKPGDPGRRRFVAMFPDSEF